MATSAAVIALRSVLPEGRGLAVSPVKEIAMGIGAAQAATRISFRATLVIKDSPKSWGSCSKAQYYSLSDYSLYTVIGTKSAINRKNPVFGSFYQLGWR